MLATESLQKFDHLVDFASDIIAQKDWKALHHLAKLKVVQGADLRDASLTERQLPLARGCPVVSNYHQDWVKQREKMKVVYQGYWTALELNGRSRSIHSDIYDCAGELKQGMHVASFWMVSYGLFGLPLVSLALFGAVFFLRSSRKKLLLLAEEAEKMHEESQILTSMNLCYDLSGFRTRLKQIEQESRQVLWFTKERTQAVCQQ